jgi:hypothetical protein
MNGHSFTPCPLGLEFSFFFFLTQLKALFIAKEEYTQHPAVTNQGERRRRRNNKNTNCKGPNKTFKEISETTGARKSMKVKAIARANAAAPSTCPRRCHLYTICS